MSPFAPRLILCPVDFDPMARLVLRWAALFAKKYGASSRILHAYWTEWPRYFTSAQVEALERQAQDQKATLRDQLKRLALETLTPTLPYGIQIAEAPAVQAIVAEVSAARPDLIIMGSQGRTGFERLRLGSVAESVLRGASTPTLVLKDPEANPQPPKIQRILCPVNFTLLDRRCLELSSALASTFQAQLAVLHASEQPGRDVEQLHDRLCQWVQGEVRTRCDLVEVVRQGNAAEQILLHARESRVDLIVVGAEHRPFLEFTTWGTTTERVLRHSNHPVLVVSWKKE